MILVQLLTSGAAYGSETPLLVGAWRPDTKDVALIEPSIKFANPKSQITQLNVLSALKSIKTLSAKTS